jgi:L-threonylcarbamoyladenylate synthase
MRNLNIRKIDAERPAEELIVLTAEILKNGGIVVAPTETKYGLLGRIDKSETIVKLYDLKKRPATMATAIFVRSHDEIARFGMETKISKKLAADFLPGPLTIVLKNISDYQKPVVVDNKIGIRYSPSPVIKKLLDAIDFFLTATSANLSGGDDLDKVENIAGMFGNDVDLYLDAGRLNAPSSTVVQCINDDYQILREGAIVGDAVTKSLMGN